MSAKALEDSPRRWLIVAVACAVVASFVVAFSSGKRALFDSSYADANLRHIDGPEASLAKLIIDLRKEKDLVGLAAMVMVDGKVVAAAADGERKKGSGVWLEIGDRWHLGGITKSITATMIARLVESGQMQWSDTIGECFPEASIHEDWKPVTLRQLLTDTAGAPANFPDEVWRKRPALGPECTRARREAVLDVIADKASIPTGQEVCVLECRLHDCGRDGREGDRRHLGRPGETRGFRAAKTHEAGFGPPKSADETLEQPRGHRVVLAGKSRWMTRQTIPRSSALPPQFT